MRGNSAMAPAASLGRSAATARASSRSSVWARIGSPSAVPARPPASKTRPSPARESGCCPTRADGPRATRCPRWLALSALCAARSDPAHSADPEVAMAEIVIVTREAPIATVQLNRPEVRNAISEQLMDELVKVLAGLDGDDTIRCIVITGSDRAFSAGADIKDNFVNATPVTMLDQDLTSKWEAIRRIRTPIVAAVSGYALGGGCELAMACDIIVASDTAQFGQPEINLGIIPGAGGTQRLTRAAGKYVANEIILTGRLIKADEARAIGLVAQVYPAASWLQGAKTRARAIAEKPPSPAPPPPGTAG